jgi:hypothetical protein
MYASPKKPYTLAGFDPRASVPQADVMTTAPRVCRIGLWLPFPKHCISALSIYLSFFPPFSHSIIFHFTVPSFFPFMLLNPAMFNRFPEEGFACF